VSFAGTAAVVQSPTQNREDILAAIDRFQLQRGTAIGSGILVSLATIFPDAGIDIEAFSRRDIGRSRSLDKAGKGDKPDFTPVLPGSYTSAAIILLTDGQRTNQSAQCRGGQLPSSACRVDRRRHHSRKVSIELLDGVTVRVADTASLAHGGRQRVQEGLIRLPGTCAAARCVLPQKLRGEAFLLKLLALPPVYLRIVDNNGATTRSAELSMGWRDPNEP